MVSLAVITEGDMRTGEHIFSTHIQEDPDTFGAMHPGGTRIYFVGDPNDHMVMVDSGEPYRSWTKQILDYHAELGRPRISAILITHGHPDHIGGLDRLQEAMGCTVRCHPLLVPYLAERLGPGCVEKVRSREVIPAGGGVSLKALFTPGHEDDHVAYFMASGRVLFSGDTILGSSSTSVRNLRQYIASLELMARQRPRVICPGHGQIIHDAAQRIHWYMKHRQAREDQVVEALKAGAGTVDDVVRAVYPRNLRRNLKQAAARNVRTHLVKLQEEGRAKEDSATYSLTPG